MSIVSSIDKPWSIPVNCHEASHGKNFSTFSSFLGSHFCTSCIHAPLPRDFAVSLKRQVLFPYRLWVQPGDMLCQWDVRIEKAREVFSTFLAPLPSLWEQLHPPLEDGDSGSRVTPLQLFQPRPSFLRWPTASARLGINKVNCMPLRCCDCLLYIIIVAIDIW